MRIKKQRNIAVVYDAVSISKDIEVIGGSLNLNYYAESATYIPNRYVTPLVLKPIIYVADPNKVIEDGNKNEELLTCEWFENDKKIISGDDYKINKDNSLTVFKNSQTDIDLSFSATWLDPRKKQVITIEDSITLTSTLLSEEAMAPRLTLDKPQNWIHNPLKGERVYTIKAYVSTDKVYDSAVEWYYVDKDKKDILIDEECSFYVSGQYTNALDVDSNYMENVIIKAKNIDNEKLKEIYWFFDKEGNPITYSEPDKTIIEGSNVFSLPESPITSKLDYRIEGLTLNQLVKNGDFSDGLKGWLPILDTRDNLSLIEGSLRLTFKEGYEGSLNNIATYFSTPKMYVGNKYYFHINIKDKNADESRRLQVRFNLQTYMDKLLKVGVMSDIIVLLKDIPASSTISYITLQGGDPSKNDMILISHLNIINLTQAFGAGNEPTKEWCDEHIQGYFEGTKSVTAPLRIKSVGENIIPRGYFIVKNQGSISEKVIDGKDCWEFKTQLPNTELYLPINKFEENTSYTIILENNSDVGLSIKYVYKDGSESTHKDYKKGWGILVAPSLENKTIDRVFIGSGSTGFFQYINKDKVFLGRGSLNEENFTPYTESNLYLNNNLELKSVGEVKDYIENGKLYKYISDDGEILEQTEIVNLSTQGNLTTYPNGTIVIEPATLVEQQYNDGLQVDLPVKSLTSIKVGKEYLDVSKSVVKDNLITHPDIENGDNVTIEYIYDENPIRNTNSIAYLVLEDILDEFWLDNVYTYKITNGEWELVKITEIEDYEEWLKTEKTSPYTLAPDGVIFGKYEADTKFLRQFPSSLYVDFYVPSRLKEEITQVKARAIVGTKDGVIENPGKYFNITWFKKENKPGSKEVEIGEGEEITIDITNKDAISLEIEDKGAYNSK